MKRSLIALIILACSAHASEPLYIVEDQRGAVTFTSRKPAEGIKYKVANKDFGYVSKVKPHEVSNRYYKRTRLATVRPYANKTFDSIIDAHARTFGVDPILIKAVIHVESAFRPKAVSPKGAQGLMQIMPATAKRFGISNVTNPEKNIYVGVKYLRWLLNYYRGQEVLALAAYNAGEGAVDKYNGIPPYPETQNYVQKVLKAKRSYSCLNRLGSSKSCVY